MSILTNNSAMVALQTLKSINTNLGQTQNAISTGKDISSARDNSAVWAISKVMGSDVQGFKAISSSLALGESTVAVARNAAETVTDLLTQMKEKIVAAQGDNVDRGKINNDVTALKGQISSVVNAAQFNGLNLVNGTAASTNILSSLDRDSAGVVTASSITVSGQNLTATAEVAAAGTDPAIPAGGLYAMTAIDVSTSIGAVAALASIETLIGTAIGAAAAFGSSEGRIASQANFVSSLTDSLRTGIGALVDANMEAASARLQALQVQQQLAVQSLSIANQAPQTILSLFR